MMQEGKRCGASNLLLLLLLLLLLRQSLPELIFFFEDLFFKESGILGIRDFILFNLFSC